MKSVKIAGIRLVNYLTDGINWKDHKDIILDFWITYMAQDAGYNPIKFRNMFLVDELPTEAQSVYEEWFNEWDFQTDADENWIEFVDGTLNIFYHTTMPTIMDDGLWYVDLMQSELQAREIVETQIYHGNPNLNSFWKMDTNTKPEEVGGRRNGYMFTRELKDISPPDTRGFFWAVCYQCPETVKLYYKDGEETVSKCINWAANAEHMTLLKVTSSGRFQVQRVFVEGKAWRDDRFVPQDNTPKNPLTGSGLNKYIMQNYMPMYGVWDKIDEVKKEHNEQINQRKGALNTFNDEEVKVSRVIDDIDEFIVRGNVSNKRRLRNKAMRQASRDKNKVREREIKKKIREMEKDKNKQSRRDRESLNPFLGKQST